MDEKLAAAMSDLENVAMNVKAERDKLAKALFEVVDATGAVDKPWELQGFGIPARRAEEICELALLGRGR